MSRYYRIGYSVLGVSAVFWYLLLGIGSAKFMLNICGYYRSICILDPVSAEILVLQLFWPYFEGYFLKIKQEKKRIFFKSDFCSTDQSRHGRGLRKFLLPSRTCEHLLPKWIGTAQRRARDITLCARAQSADLARTHSCQMLNFRLFITFLKIKNTWHVVR